MPNFLITSLKYVGFILYGILFPCILWLMLFFVTPYIMSLGWYGFIGYIIFTSGIIFSVINFLSVILSVIPLYLMSHWTAKILPFLSLIFYGYSSIIFPWKFNFDYDFLKILLALSLNVEAIIIFTLPLNTIFTISKKIE
jgi:hypothetical protein